MAETAHNSAGGVNGNGTESATHANPEYEVYEEDQKQLPRPRILLMGPRRSGKSSIKQVVFYKMSPHETNWLQPTPDLDIQYAAYNEFCQFQLWDFPGDFDTSVQTLRFGGELVTEYEIFQGVSALVLIVDAQDDPVDDALPQLVHTVRRAHMINPALDFEIFIHKVDGDLFLSEEHKVDCQRDVQNYIATALNQDDLEVKLSYYLTSIYDHSIFDAISKVVQKLIPQLPTLENLLNCLISNCLMEKCFLFDIVSRIYLATDLNPVDMSSYELCCDMIDLVVDVSGIYGTDEENDDLQNQYAYDKHSGSIIRLSNDMVLYLREVGGYLALVCLITAENFSSKEGLIDYNITQFKTTLAEVFNRPPIKKLRQRIPEPAEPDPPADEIDSSVS